MTKSVPLGATVLRGTVSMTLVLAVVIAQRWECK